MGNIDIHDRVNEAYYGTLGSESFIAATRERVHWIGARTFGKYVLDVGCSQGIQAILLGREGREVVAIDISERSIKEANEYLKKEEKSTQERVEFLQADFINFISENKYDTIIMSEVLEHLMDPIPFIEKAKECLKEDGVLLVSVPFGINDYIDHKRTYYYGDMFSYLSKYFQIKEFEIIGKWIGFVCKNSNIRKQEIDINDLRYIEKNFYILERNLVNSNNRLRDKDKELQTRLQDIAKKNIEIEKKLKSTLSYRIGNRIINAKSIGKILKLPYDLYRDYQGFKLSRKQKSNFIPGIKFDSKILLDKKKTFRKTFKNLKSMKMAVIMDEFTYSSFSCECELLQISPYEWKKEIANFKPDLLFIESAWQGKDHLWERKVSSFSDELQEVIKYCQNNGIPTAFWSKEDPVHFSTFLSVACAVDFVFTTDIDCVFRYKYYTRKNNVYCLPFAAQPKIHNPIEEFDRKDEFNFAGSYYLRYPQRQSDFKNVVNAAKQYKNVSIYDRNYDRPHPHYSFPDIYKDMIIGNLPFEQIVKAYKGYRFGITMNTVKTSQTMFARRAFELIACNTFVVSNFSRGLRNFFGDLVIASDNERELAIKLKKVCNDTMYYKKIKLNALRKVMAHHTYADRLSFIVDCIFGEKIVSLENSVTAYMLAIVDCQDDCDKIIESFQQQNGVLNKQLIFYFKNNIELRVANEYVCFDQKQDLLEFMQSKNNAVFGILNAENYYGKDYLIDLMLSLKYSNFNAFGKYSFYELDNDSLRLHNEDFEYKIVPFLSIDSSLMKVEYLNEELLSHFIDKNFSYKIDNMIGIDCFNFCKNARSLSLSQKSIIESLQNCDNGISVEGLNEICNREIVAKRDICETPDLNKLNAKFIYDNIEKSSSSKFKFSFENDVFKIESKLTNNEHKYFYFQKTFTREELNFVNNSQCLLVGSFPSDCLKLVFEFQDSNRSKISHSLNNAGSIETLVIPGECKYIRLGLRIQGQCLAEVKSLILDSVSLAPSIMVAKSKTLVLAKQYPSYNDLYKYGFLHTRVKAYKESGYLVDTFKISNTERYSCREFEGIDVVTASNAVLEETLKSGQYQHILVHFMDRNMWSVLEKFVDKIKIAIWIHGAEIQMWQRRFYNFKNKGEAEIQRQKELSEERKKLWRHIFGLNHQNLHFVFVSEHFKSESLGDIGVELSKDRYSIIHNPIDTELFAYMPKTKDLRRKIISIRPFNTKGGGKYANDISVKTILELSKRQFFRELEFLIVGDGDFFDEILQPLKGFDNVRLERKFLQQREIAKLHQEFGVLLIPTRMDAQGVSRDEGMSCGLVPVTNNIAAIPEFVDRDCGILAEPEDFKGLADAIEFLYKNPDEFLRLSKNAADRVRKQSAESLIIQQEIELFK